MKGLTKLVLAAVMAVGLLAFSTPALASIVIDFGTGSAGTGGTITDLGGGQYSGSGIPVQAMSVTGTASMDGVYGTSGTASGTGGSGFASLAFDTVADTITITGGIPTLGLGSQTLLSGSFSSYFAIYPASGFISFFGGGPDSKSRELLDALGIAPGTPFAFFGFSSGGFGAQGSYSVLSTDITNTSVPEPGSMLLLGTGLFGLGGAIRRRLIAR